MGKRNLDEELNFIENKMKKLCGYDDDSVLRDLAEAEAEWERQKAADPEAAARLEEEADKSFDLLMEKAKREREWLANEVEEKYTGEEDEEYSDYFDEEAEEDDLEEAGFEETEETEEAEETEKAEELGKAWEIRKTEEIEEAAKLEKAAKAEKTETKEEIETIERLEALEELQKQPAISEETVLKQHQKEHPAEESVKDSAPQSEELLNKSQSRLEDTGQSEPVLPVIVLPESSKQNTAEAAKEHSEITDMKPSKRTKWSRKAVILVAAVAVMVIGGGIVATATTRREYQYELIQGEKTRLIRHNTMITVKGDKLEEAYNRVKEELGISVVILGYQPSNLFFNQCVISNRRAVLEFENEGKMIYLHESVYPLEEDHSVMTVSDRNAVHSVDNYWLNRKLSIEENILEDGMIEYSTGFSNDGVYYYLAGIIEKDEFIAMVENLCYMVKE